MNLLKGEIIERLEGLPEIDLNRVLDFVDSLTRGRTEVYKQSKN